MQTSDVAKDRHLHMRIGPEDEQRLAALAKHYEMPESQVVRMLIKRDAEAHGLGSQSDTVAPPEAYAPPDGKVSPTAPTKKTSKAKTPKP